MKVYIVHDSRFVSARVFATLAAARNFAAKMIRLYRRNDEYSVSVNWSGRIWDVGDGGEYISLFGQDVEGGAE